MDELEVRIESEFKSVPRDKNSIEMHIFVQLVGGETSKERRAIHNSLLVDISGSTGDRHEGTTTKLDAIKNAILSIPRYAKDGDTLSIIPFSTDAYVAGEYISARDRQAIARVVSPLVPTQRTNFYAPLMLGIKDTQRDNVVDHPIILLSDGLVNTGKIADIGELIDWIKPKGIRVNTIGFGMESDMKGLRKLAEATGGISAFSLTTSDLRRALASMIVPSDYYTATDISLSFKASESTTIMVPTTDYDVMGTDIDRCAEIGKMYPNEVRNFLFKITAVLPMENDGAKVLNIGKIDVHYKVGDKLNTISSDVVVPIVSRTWKIAREKNRAVTEMLQTVTMAETWLKGSNFSDTQTCVCGTCVSINSGKEEEGRTIGYDANKSSRANPRFYGTP